MAAESKPFWAGAEEVDLFQAPATTVLPGQERFWEGAEEANLWNDTVETSPIQRPAPTTAEMAGGKLGKPPETAAEAIALGASAVPPGTVAAFNMEPTPTVVEPAYTPPLVIRAADAGVEYDNPAPVGHFAASLSIDDKGSFQAYKTALSSYFNEDIKIRRGEATGELEYLNPDTNRWALVMPPGASMEAVEGLGGPAITLSAEALLGVAGGSLTKSTKGALAGGATGAFLGELARLEMGNRLGVHNLTPEQMMKEAGKLAGLSAVTGYGAERIMALGRFMLNSARGRMLPADVIDGLQLDAREAGRLSEQINRRLQGAEFQFSLGQATGSEAFLAVEKRLANSPRFSEAIGQFKEDQAQALSEFVTSINRPFTTDLDDVVHLRTLNLEATRRANRQERILDGYYERKSAEVQQMLTGLKDRPYEDLGATLRELGAEKQVAFREWADEASDHLDRVAGRAAFIENNNLHAVISKLDSEAREALFPKMESAIRRLIGKLPDEAGEEVVDQAEERAIRKVLDPEAKFSFREAWRAVSFLKRMERISSKGLTTDDPDPAMAKMLYSALEKDMREGMSSIPELGALYDDFVSKYRSQKTLLDRGVVGSILKRDPQSGAYALSEDRVFAKVFVPNDSQPAQQLLKLVEGNPQAHDAVSQSIIDNWKRKVVGQDGRISQSAHRSWIEKHRRAAEVFLSKEEMERLENPVMASRALENRVKRRAKAQQAIARSLNARLSQVQDPGSLKSLLFQEQNPDVVRDVLKWARGDRQMLTGLRDLAREEVLNRISSIGPEGRRVFSSKGLETFLDGKSGERGFSGHLEALFGEQYVRDMRTLARATALLEREPKSMLAAGTSATGRIFNDIIRAQVGLFTRTGRFLTAGQRLTAGRAQNVLMRAATNPDDLRRLLEYRDIPTQSKAGRRLLAQLGATWLLVDNDPEEAAQ